MAISVPVGPMRSAISRAWPPAPKVQSMAICARLRIQRLDQLAGEDRDVGGGHVIRDSEHHAVAGASNAAEMSKMSAASWSL